MKLSLVIPCYNEIDSIEELINLCKKIINSYTEIIIVDNGSTDGSYKKLKNLKLPKNIKIKRVRKNIGYGNGILKGLKVCRGEIISWTHADLQTDPNDIINSYNLHKHKLLSKTCIVKGERKGRNFLDNFFTLGMSIYSSFILGERLFDINAQPKMFHKSFLKEFNNPPLDFSLDLYILYFFKKKNIEIIPYPVFFNKRKYGKAKGGGSLMGKFKLISRTFKYINNLRKID